MIFLKENWWKVICSCFLIYTLIFGLTIKMPSIDNRMQETVRNIFFHVPMWFAMMILLTLAVFQAILFLKTSNPKHGLFSYCLTMIGVYMGILGLITGAIWAKYQWGSAWSGDPKQNGAAIAVLMYLGYFIIRKNIKDNDKINKISAVYNIFAYCMLFPTIWILPRLSESLHPGGQGSSGNPGLNPKDLDNNIRMVFYPAVIGFTLLGFWLATLHLKIKKIELETI